MNEPNNNVHYSMQDGYMKDTPKRPGKRIWIPVASVALVLVLSAAGVFWHRSSLKKAIEARTQEALSEENISVTGSNILGSYTVHIETDSQKSTCTGYIDSDAQGVITLHILSEYEPRLFQLEIEADGTVFNDELGTGRMSYKKSIDRTSIRFQKDSLKCTLTK
jgi:hypothetical protein